MELWQETTSYDVWSAPMGWVTAFGQAWFQPEARARLADALERMRALAADKGCSMANLAVAWTLGAPGVTAAIVGARDAEQASENAHAAAISLSAEERRTLGSWFAGAA